jgi:hypothetical protein
MQALGDAGGNGGSFAASRDTCRFGERKRLNVTGVMTDFRAL